jgi:outer membrane usher protein
VQRAGVSDKFSAQLHAQLGPAQRLFGLAGTLQLGRAGIVSPGLALSSGRLGSGSQLTLGYDYGGRYFSAGGVFKTSSLSYAEPSLAGQFDQPRTESQARLSAELGRQGSLSAAYTDLQTPLTSRLKILTLGFSRRLGGGSLIVNANRILGSGQTLLSAQFLVPLDSRRSYATGVDVSPAGVRPLFQYQENLPATATGYAFNVRAEGGEGGAQTLGFTRQSPSGSLSVSAGRMAGQRYWQSELSGALAFSAGRTFLTRRIDQSFAVAQVPGYANVRVYVNNQQAGTTDARGYVFLPNLMAYEPNAIRLEVDDLDVAANVAAPQVTAVPYYRSGMFVRFASETAGGFVLTVDGPDGRPLPAGTMLSTPQSSQTFPVAADGQAYLTALQPGTYEVTGKTDSAVCGFVLTVKSQPGGIVDLGSFVCRP